MNFQDFKSAKLLYSLEIQTMCIYNRHLNIYTIGYYSQICMYKYYPYWNICIETPALHMCVYICICDDCYVDDDDDTVHLTVIVLCHFMHHVCLCVGMSVDAFVVWSFLLFIICWKFNKTTFHSDFFVMGYEAQLPETMGRHFWLHQQHQLGLHVFFFWRRIPACNHMLECMYVYNTVHSTNANMIVAKYV